MLKLFKQKKTHQQIIAEIHNEFDTAQERLLDESDKLLLELNIQTETNIEIKADKLKNLGFINSEVVKQAQQLKNKLVQSKEQAELIRYYKQTYPFQKFLTEKELERICEKYKLIFAPVSHYVKDVPSKNIEEIENCSNLKAIDFIKNRKLLKITKFMSGLPISIESKLNGTLDITDISDEEVNKILSGSGDRILKKIFNLDYSGYIYHDATLIEEDRNGLFIAAPPSHFNLNGLSKQNKYSFFRITETQVDDPIVFRYCRGGVQVISKWGLEAEDAGLVNEKLN